MSDFSTDEDSPRPAFPVTKDYLPPVDGPPTSVEEYLSLVHHQSAALPKVLVSRLNPISPQPSAAPLQSRLALPHTPAYLCPHPDWQSRLVVSFRNLQHSLQLHSSKYNDENPSPVAQQLWKDTLFRESAQLPMLDVVLHLDHMRIVDALRTIDLEITVESSEKRKGTNEAHAFSEKFSRGNCCVWLFSLLSMLALYVFGMLSKETSQENGLKCNTNQDFRSFVVLCVAAYETRAARPLSNEPAAILRSLLRKACMARLAYAKEDGESESKHVSRLQTCGQLARINVLITLLARVFGQGDQT